ncbi:MAG: hypothetical protein QE271_01095 [Bacteriovoracaceae bacterium]|nr:hypothetical protein [Bacteriovoracaceae bacterium]
MLKPQTMGQARLNAFSLQKKELERITFFGHTSHGVPGLEIVGLGNYGKILKEKIVFLSKSRNLKFPLLRYVICKEGIQGLTSQKIDQEFIEWFDLPIFILYLSLGQQIQISRLSDCITHGKIRPCGEIIQSHQVESKFLDQWSESKETILTFEERNMAKEFSKSISLQTLFENIPELTYRKI